MTLQDQIIDEAEELAHEENGYLPAAEIADAVSDRIGVKLYEGTNLYRLAQAAYNRIWYAESQIREVLSFAAGRV